MAKHTEHTILGVIENMSYFESKETGKKSMFSEKEEAKSFLMNLRRNYLLNFL